MSYPILIFLLYFSFLFQFSNANAFDDKEENYFLNPSYLEVDSCEDQVISSKEFMSFFMKNPKISELKKHLKYNNFNIYFLKRIYFNFGVRSPDILSLYDLINKGYISGNKLERKDFLREILAKEIKKSARKKEQSQDQSLDFSLIKKTNSSVAKYIFSEQDILNKEASSQYLLEKKNISILKEYLSFLHFKDLDISLALRALFLTINPPKGSDELTQLVQVFTYEYSQQNLSLSQEEAEVLALAVLMLNSSFHNKNIAKVSSLDKKKFIHLCSEIPLIRGFSTKTLAHIYDSIKRHPLQI